MKKNLIALGIVALSTTQLNAQTYTLSKGVTVGCANANPITDVSKKIDLAIDGSNATFTLSSLNCQKQYKGTALKLENEAKAYIDTKENKAVILTKDDRIALVVQNSGNYVVVVGGHLDKKSAKLVNTEDLNAELKASLSKFPSLLEEAKKEAERAEMQTKMLPIPSGNYSDKYGIGGLYYFSEPAAVITGPNNGKFAQAVLLQFDENDKFTLKAYLDDKSYDKYFFETPKMFNAFKEGRVNPILTHTADNMNQIQFLRSGLTRLEEGVYLVNYRGWFTTKGTTCSDVSFKEDNLRANEIKNGASKYILLGKDKTRIDYLLSHTDELEILAENATISRCKFADALRAEAKPMPAASSMNTGQLATEATTLTKEFAKGRWAQEVQYAFISGNEWVTLRNPITGIITGRIVSAVAVMKEEDGSCRWEEISIRQNYDGANYGKSYFGGETAFIVPVDCATAMKYKK